MDDNDKSKPDLPRFGLARQPDGAVFINPYNNLFYIVEDGKLVLADQEYTENSLTKENKMSMI